MNITIEDNGIGLQKKREHWGMGFLGIETKVQMLASNPSSMEFEVTTSAEVEMENKPGLAINR